MLPKFPAITNADAYFDMYPSVLGRLENYIRHLGPKIPVNIIIELISKKITKKQMGYYWGGILKLIAEHTGHSRETLDQFLKFKYLSQMDDHGIKWVPSKTELTTRQAAEYMELCRNWAMNEFGIYVPDPDEVKIERIEL